MLKVGLTGGIGSGKSTVSQVFINLGVPVFNSDMVARNIVNTNSKAIKKIKSAFGEHLYDSGELDRKALAAIVFTNPDALEQLNSIVHPLVGESFNKWCEKHASAPYIIKEAAILFESGAHQNLDRIITVYTKKEERIRRIMARDNVSAEDVEHRMNNQWTDETRNKLADFIIINDDKDKLLPQVMELHEVLLNIE
ncbi:dephospho-CoA kinase [Acidiluteibacter ferrifornacis]|uniref:Dephospho-CoA kinase n=1 Tax=Acidiluteibacter ferrifornacis TaxID=2692424 RepID=A0A6N9NN49_9FLAO|nr:dephospho-CoA kinase [Acidiluteibacter ferrifornacis]NBG67289.1 dephospho-CoA kinase [Acidiluteibacter ferrifornacis]